jgi:uncharacterized protein
MTDIMSNSTSTIIFFLLCLSPFFGVSQSYNESIESWRETRAANLQAPKGWLSLAGLFWLEEGANTFGAAKDNDFVFPEGAPERMGAFLRLGDSVWVEMNPDIPQTDRFSWAFIERGGKWGVRLWDAENPARSSFKGIDYYPISKKWRVRARFEVFSEPRILKVPNVLGMEIEQRSPGVLKFRAGGKNLELLALEETEHTFFLIFLDANAGAETYGGGRYLSVSKPGPDGMTIIDFNKAYNPPCVFTPYATCLLPPAENRLKIAVRAGEKYH